jgi:hypothetical protein
MSWEEFTGRGSGEAKNFEENFYNQSTFSNRGGRKKGGARLERAGGFGGQEESFLERFVLGRWVDPEGRLRLGLRLRVRVRFAGGSG